MINNIKDRVTARKGKFGVPISPSLNFFEAISLNNCSDSSVKEFVKEHNMKQHHTKEKGDLGVLISKVDLKKEDLLFSLQKQNMHHLI